MFCHFTRYLIHLVIICFGICSGQYKKCEYELEILWSHEIGHSAFAAPPLITDADADGHLDIIATLFTEEVIVIQGSTGKTLKDSNWPIQMTDDSFHSSPLQHDINKDGSLDILLCTSEGQLIFLDYKGQQIENTSVQLPGVQVQKDWYSKVLSVGQLDIHDYILDDSPSGDKVQTGYVAVDPHILATPVLADLNRDGVIEELVIPVSYYFDLDWYRSQDSDLEALGVNFTELENYLVGAIVIFNLTSLEVIRSVHLELTKITATFPGYVMFSPTVIDLDSNDSDLEIVIGTSAGKIHALDIQGRDCQGFPLHTETIHGQVAVVDLDKDGHLELISVDTSGNVFCHSATGDLVWEGQVSGSSTMGVRVADINQDGVQEVVIAANDGQLWVLDGNNGENVEGWPFMASRSLTMVPLLTRMFPTSTVDIVILSDDGNLHILAGNNKCKKALSLGESSYVPVLTHDLVPSRQGLELLVATKDGTLLCLGNTNRTSPSEMTETESRRVGLDSWPSENCGQNSFTFHDSQMGLHIIKEQHIEEISGSWFTLPVEIVDESHESILPQYTIQVYFGSSLLTSESHLDPGRHAIPVPCPNEPVQGHVVVRLVNQHGQVFQDMIAVRFNMGFQHDLQWLLVCPFVAMGVTLLLLHGYPSVDLLPFAHTDKGR